MIFHNRLLKGLRPCLVFSFIVLGICANARLSLASEPESADQTIFTFNVIDSNLKNYKQFLSGRNPLNIKTLKQQSLLRNTWELFLFQIAPVIGGCECRIQYQAYALPTPHARSIADVAAGINLSHPVAGLRDDERFKKQNIILSEPILHAKDFYVGLYTDQSRLDILNMTDLDEIRNLRFITSRHWSVDMNFINEKGLTLIKTDIWSSIVNMLKAKRADVLLQPFSYSLENGARQIHDLGVVEMLPIPNVKMYFNQQRHFFVSRKHPQAEHFLNALNKGIKILTDNGFIDEGNKIMGVTNEAFDDWQVLE